MASSALRTMLKANQFITAPGVFDLVSAKLADRTGQARGKSSSRPCMTALPHSGGASVKSKYTMIDDVRKLFTEHMNSLYLLAFLLTGNQGDAERSFVAGLADCVDGK